MLRLTHRLGFASRPSEGNDNFTQFLAHCNGPNASTAFFESSQNKFTITANGNAQITTAQLVFGAFGSSCVMDGSSDFLSCPDNVLLRPGTGEFTVDFWARFNAGSLFQTL